MDDNTKMPIRQAIENLTPHLRPWNPLILWENTVLTDGGCKPDITRHQGSQQVLIAYGLQEHAPQIIQLELLLFELEILPYPPPQ